MPNELPDYSHKALDALVKYWTDFFKRLDELYPGWDKNPNPVTDEPHPL